MAEGRDRMRAADADRAVVVERLRTALDEGRLDLGEYDERLQRAYASKTYAELDLLLADLPAPAAAQRSELASYPGPLPAHGAPQPGPDGRYPHATRGWLVETWAGYAKAVAIVVAIWVAISVVSGELRYFWPAWMAGPWGAVLLVATVGGLATGEPQRWAAKQARKEQARREKRARRELAGEQRRDRPGTASHPEADPEADPPEGEAGGTAAR